MNNKRVITVKCAEAGYEDDLEVPGDIPMNEFYPLLLDALKEDSPRVFGNVADISCSINKYTLSGNDTFDSCGVMNGSVLEVRRL